VKCGTKRTIRVNWNKKQPEEQRQKRPRKNRRSTKETSRAVLLDVKLAPSNIYEFFGLKVSSPHMEVNRFK
jgi:hypothetical protein